ncbi:hypothetical protein AAC03nite_31240 [Alicyclobacillus acidoterrestris]|nr:hypothetical protein AAC03nite_31240 [Alicyclobacillus acidoterrestris]
MKWRNSLAAVIGAWFIVAPWALQFSGNTTAVWLSVVLGAIQLLSSAWAAYAKQSGGWKQWQLWVSIVTGVWFVIQPFIFSLNVAETWISVILGVITVVLHVWTMAVKEDASTDKTKSGHHAHA